MNRIRKGFALLLCLLLLAAALTGCGKTDTVPEAPEAPEQEETGEETENMTEPEKKKVRNSSFAMRFSSDDSLNPLYCRSVANTALMSLIYEGLFRLDEHFEPCPVLCSEYGTEDGKTWWFTLIDAVMHDGSDLKPVDVSYTINLARDSDKYRSRLAGIAACYDNGDGRVIVELKEENRNLPALLDVPIICAGKGDDYAPAGTGPYVYRQVGKSSRLEYYAGYRDAASVKTKTLFLKEFAEEVLEDKFSDRSLDMLWDGGSDTGSLHLYGEYETHCYDTTLLQYVGFNFNRIALQQVSVRRAIACAVDREMIVSEIYGGVGRPTELLYNPAYRLYEDAWADAQGFSLAEMSANLAAAGLQDHDNDGLLEYDYGGGYWETLTFRFLVYEGSAKKVAAAQAIAANLNRVGLNVRVTALPWEEYLQALEAGRFELYYGEAALPHDFDFSALLTLDGALRYGKTGGSTYAGLIRAVKQAADDEALKEAAAALCRYAAEDVPIVPVQYRQNVVYTHRGEITGFSPTVSGIFQSVKEWPINLS